MDDLVWFRLDPGPGANAPVHYAQFRVVMERKDYWLAVADRGHLYKCLAFVFGEDPDGSIQRSGANNCFVGSPAFMRKVTGWKKLIQVEPIVLLGDQGTPALGRNRPSYEELVTFFGLVLPTSVTS